MMNRNLIFVFILLATFSMVNAIPHNLLKRDPTIFGACPPIPKVPTQPIQLAVTISPNPVVPGQSDSFTASGKFPVDLTTSDSFVVGFADNTGQPIGTPTVVPACTGKCPKAGE